MLVELIALLGATTAGLALALVVRDSDVDHALWLASWPVLALEGALIVARDTYASLGYAEQFVGPWVPALQLAGVLQFVGRRSSRWLFPVAALIGLTRVILTLAGPETARYLIALTFDCVAYGLATWSLAREAKRQQSASLTALGVGLGSMTLVNLLNTVFAMQGRDVSSAFWALWTVVVIPNFAMQVAAVLRRSRERARQALQSERRDVTNLLVGGVAHDFNNLLTIISGFSQLAESDMRSGQPERAQESLGQVRTAVDRAAVITRRLLEHVEAVPHALKLLHLREILASVCTRRNAMSSASTIVQCNVPDALPPINGDRRLLETAIDLLVQNAVESGGPMPISIRVRVERAERLMQGDAETSAPPGNYVMVTVADRGSGIPEPLRARLFQPFFSTREVGRGLGLAAVAGIARVHSGMVQLKTSGAGTSVSLWFPCAPAVGEAAA